MVQGRLYTQDLNQFLGRGIPLMEELAKQFGVAENQVKQLVEDGKVGFPEVQKAIENLTNEGSKFGGLMEAQSKTITGQISNIEDAIDTMFNAIGQSQEGVINTSLGLVSTLIENWETVGNILLTIIATYGAYKAAVIAVAAAMLLFNMAVKANPLGLVLSVLAAAVTAFLAFRKSTDEAADALKKEREEAEAFNKQVSESAGKAISTYKRLQDEYKKCKSAHEKREWIKESQAKFKELKPPHGNPVLTKPTQRGLNAKWLLKTKWIRFRREAKCRDIHTRHKEAMNTLTAAEHGFTPRQVREKPVKRSNRQSPMTLF